MGIFFDSGEKKLLDKVIGAETFTVHLYVNDHTPVNTDGTMAFTEATWMGYAPQALSGFTASTTNSAGKAQSTANQLTFTIGANLPGPQNVYGWYLTDQDGILLGAERFANAPLIMQASGDNIKLTVTLTMSSDPPNP
jgi:hypothetical protein